LYCAFDYNAEAFEYFVKTRIDIPKTSRRILAITLARHEWRNNDGKMGGKYEVIIHISFYCDENHDFNLGIYHEICFVLITQKLDMRHPAGNSLFKLLKSIKNKKAPPSGDA
jgi:hypothetical protein